MGVEGGGANTWKRELSHNNIFIMNSFKEGALADLKEVTDHLELLSFLISWEKSVI